MIVPLKPHLPRPLTLRWHLIVYLMELCLLKWLPLRYHLLRLHFLKLWHQNSHPFRLIIVKKLRLMMSSSMKTQPIDPRYSTSLVMSGPMNYSTKEKSCWMLFRTYSRKTLHVTQTLRMATLLQTCLQQMKRTSPLIPRVLFQTKALLKKHSK